MAFLFEFTTITGHKVDETLQFALLKGDTGQVIHRDNVTENVNPNGIVYDLSLIHISEPTRPY